MSAGGGPAGCPWGRPGRGHGRGFHSVTPGAPTPGSAARSCPVPEVSCVWSLAGPWGPWGRGWGYRERGPSRPIWLAAPRRRRHTRTHTHSLLTPSTGQQTRRRKGAGYTQWHTRSRRHTGTLMLAHTRTFTATRSSRTMTHHHTLTGTHS